MRAIVLALLPAALLLGSAGHAEKIGTLQFKDCDLPLRGTKDVIQAQCATLTVAENPALPDGRKIDLRLARVPSKAGKAAGDPVFFLAGGPGQSALEAYPSVASAFARIIDQRDVLLLDQRGTGGSHPLDCKLDAESLADASSQDPGRSASFAKRCVAKLDADPRFYTTTDAVRDLEAVRAALGVDKINLVGGSYGTRLAQEYLRRHPQHVRAVILDGVVPPQLALGSEHARNLDTALASISARCTQDESCSKAFGDVQATLMKLRSEVIAQARDVAIRDPQSGKPEVAKFDIESLVAVARIFAYAPETAALLPYALDEAAKGRPEVLVQQGKLIAGDLGERIMHGMELSVICAEDADLVQEDPAAEGTLLGNNFAQFLAAQCAVWPKGDRPVDFHAPLASDVPVLLLSGEFDPVTPPRYGEQALKQFSRGRHLVAKGQGHIILGRGCMPKLIGEFMAKIEPEKLDVGCMDVLGPSPAFVTANGWEP
jgi:pimeloyl-ACP methyl ester carboxylesterase